MSKRMQQTGLLVAGMHRSGTSAVTGSLGRLGISLGGSLLEPGEDNPKGYFEHEQAVAIDDALLDALNRRWDDIRALPQGWQHGGAAKAAVEAIADMVRLEFAQVPVFAVKDPRLCRLLPVWLDGLAKADVEARVLLVVRHPREVAASIQRRNGWPALVSEVLWLRHMLAAERDTRHLRRVALTYDQLIQAPMASMQEALKALGVEAVRKASGQLDGFVSGEDRHFDDGAGPDSATYVAEIAREAYVHFVDLAQGKEVAPAKFDALSKRLEWALAESKPLIDSLAQVSLGLHRSVAVARDEALRLRSELNAQVVWSDTAIVEQEKLQAELAQVRSELNAQLAWSDTAVAEQEKLQAELAQVRSELNAQLAWSDTAVAEQEKLQAELAQVRSELNAQLAWAALAVAEREKLQESLAEASSKLTAQLAWSDTTVAEREKLQAELAQVRSELNAQLAWAELAVAEREKLQESLTEASSQLAAQLAWSDTAVAEREKLQAELAQVRSELNAQLAWAASAVAEREKLQESLVETASKLAAQIAWSEESMRIREALQGQLQAAVGRGDALQLQFDQYEATLAGRLLRKWVNRKAAKGNKP